METLGSGGNMKLISNLKQVIYMSLVVVGSMCLVGCGDDTLGTSDEYSYDIGEAQPDPELDSSLNSEANHSSNHVGVEIHRVPRSNWIDFDDSKFSDDNYSDNLKNIDKEENYIGYDDNKDNKDNKDNDINKNNNDSYADEQEFENSKIVSVNGYKCYNVTKDVCEIEYTIFKKTNEYRVARGLSQLKPNMALSATARSWSNSQSRMGYISHTGFPNSRNTILRGFDSDSSLDSREISFLSGENVAATGYSFNSNAAVGESFYTMWINSPGHRQNIVGSHTYLGVGVVKTSSGMFKFYATQIFGR